MSSNDNDRLQPLACSETEITETQTTPRSRSDVQDEYEGMSKSQAWNLYTSHFLSTWNVRTYEFAAIIFTAAAYPDTLVASSIRGIVRTLASICFASTVGRWVDHSPHRLKTLSSTISVNRISVVSASILWFFIVQPSAGNTADGSLNPTDSFSPPTTPFIKGAMFSLILSLGILETLSASGNMLSMERDFVVTAASPDGQPYDLTHLNSIIRRIDLICKLIAPILISLIVSSTSVSVGVLVVGGMSAVSWGIELFCAKRVWVCNSRLRVLKSVDEQTSSEISPDANQETLLQNFWTRCSHGLRRYRLDFKNYFSSPVWIPSMALSLLHLSVLAYNATFITFLLNIGFSLDLITIARAAGSVVEISSTVVTPVGVQYLAKAKSHGRFVGSYGVREEDTEDPGMELLEVEVEEARDVLAGTETGLERLGLWGITWQLVNLIPVVFALWSLSPSSDPITTAPPIASRLLTSIPIPSQPLLAFTLFAFLSLSRLGLWIFDLTTQQLTQILNPPSRLSTFTGVEYSFVSLFELAQNVITVVLSRSEEFRWIGLGSLVAVGFSAGLYAAWVRGVRGHLVHWERFGEGCGGACGKNERER